MIVKIFKILLREFSNFKMKKQKQMRIETLRCNKNVYTNSMMNFYIFAQEQRSPYIADWALCDIFIAS